MRWDLLEVCARKATNRPTAVLYMAESLNAERDGFDGFRVGVMDTTTLTSGPRKGKPNYKAGTNKQERLISREAADEVIAEWAAETGGCVECGATGRQFKSWTKGEGSTFAPCVPCDGTGRADRIPVEPDQGALFA